MAKLRIRRQRRKKKGPCSFCVDKTVPSFRNVELISRFITERGMILSRGSSDVCAKHQRKLASAIKHARHIALLPFIVKPY